MAANATLRGSITWRTPRHVRLDGDHVVADFNGHQTYPILAAAHEGRALQALVNARTEEDVCVFTRSWGFLHDWTKGGRTDRFPLALFYRHQQYFLALTRLSVAVRRNV